MKKFCPLCNSCYIVLISNENKWFCAHCCSLFSKPNKNPDNISHNSEILKRLTIDVPYQYEVSENNYNRETKHIKYVLIRDKYKCCICNRESE